MTRFGVVRAAILRPHPWWWGAAVTLLCIAAASAVRWALGAAADPVPFVTYFPAIMLAALLAGWRWGAAAIALAAATVNGRFLGMAQRWSLDGASLATVALFVLSSLVLVAIAQTLRRTFAELEAANRHAEFLNRELRHRVRNTLSVVQALADRSLRNHPDDFRRVFSDRLSALARAHDVLASGASERCDLGDVVERACAPFRDDGNIAAEGPACRIEGAACVPLALALHELCTNAVKHGALSSPAGKVALRWTADGEDRVAIEWIEAGGPPVYPPKRQGLGTILLTGQPELEGCALEFHPGGLRCRMRVARCRED
jgi:two-component sensor histidine kinase